MTWLTARELAGLPGLPSSAFRCRARLESLGIPHRPRAGRCGGGGLEYDTAALPAETRAALQAREIVDSGERALQLLAAPAPAPAQGQASTSTSTLPALPAARRPPSDADRAVADARIVLADAAEALAGQVGLKRAVAQLALRLATGEADTALQGAAAAANLRARAGGAALSARSLERYVMQRRQGGWWSLLPAPAEACTVARRVAQDVAAVLGLYHSRNPQFRLLTDAAREVTKQLQRPYDEWETLYDRARRALKKVDKVALIKARHTGAERAALLPFERRDVSGFLPNDIWVIDGHTFKAKVRHPDHGAPFAPEVTVALDAHTRRIVGWSASLSENTIAVGDALRHAVGHVGLPCIVYSDGGAGETGKALDCPIVGIYGRLGIEHRVGRPGHPQGHGLIERSWRTHAIAAARKFASYQGHDADAGTYRKVAAELAKEQRALARAQTTGEVITLSPKLPSWAQFVDQMRATIDEYNSLHRHSSLPRRADGKHMTPDEAWAASFDPALHHPVSAEQARQLFMPGVLRTARRGEVKFFGQVYAAPELMQVDGQEVSVRYDIHDPARVDVYTLGGEYVCAAGWNANRRDFYPKAVVDMARERRAATSIKLREQQIDRALRELTPPVQGLTLDEPELIAPLLRPLPEPVEAFSGGDAPDARPSFFDVPGDRYEWLMRHRGAWGPDDEAWLERYVRSDDYEALADYYAGRGLAWPAADDGDALFKGAR